MSDKGELQKYQVPTLEELASDKALISAHNDLNILLNKKPPENWLKKHPTVNVKKTMPNGTKVEVPLEYLPIEMVEQLLSRIFVKWCFEIKSVSTIANSVVVIGRLHYLNPVTNQMEWTDGAGANPIHTRKGASATDFSQVLTLAVQQAVPAAESYALKDAAEKLGNLFGKNLGRDYAGDDAAILYAKGEKMRGSMDDDKLAEITALYFKVDGLLSPEEDTNARRIINSQEKNSYDKLLSLLKTKIPQND